MQIPTMQHLMTMQYLPKLRFLPNLELKIRYAFYAFALATPFVCVTASAQQINSSYQMMTYDDAAYGELIIAGDYDKAIEKITAAEFSRAELDFSNTNLCVAYTLSGNFESAELACETAKSSAERLRLGSRGNGFDAQKYANRRTLAVALSNRSVLYAVMGESELARELLEKAIALRSHINVPKKNLARLERTRPATLAANEQFDR